MKDLLKTLLIGVLLFVLIVGIILLIGIGLEYVLSIIPCEILVYIETGLLLGIFTLIAYIALNGKDAKLLKR